MEIKHVRIVLVISVWTCFFFLVWTRSKDRFTPALINRLKHILVLMPELSLVLSDGMHPDLAIGCVCEMGRRMSSNF